MNKKYISYLLIILIIIENAFTQDIISKTYNTENTLTYWTKERMLNTKPLPKPLIFKNKTINNSEKNMIKKNMINTRDKNDKPFAVGILFGQKNSTENFICTASVIRSDDGNTGITAVHCLYDWETNVWADNMNFWPGYDHGEQSRYGCVAVKKVNISLLYINGEGLSDDYGILKFNYNGRLQDNTGCFGWGIQPGYPVEIVTFGYPEDGEMDCVKDTSNLCSWRGNASLLDNPPQPYQYIPLDLGDGSSKGPWVIKNSPPNNLGYLMGITYGTVDSKEFSEILNFTLISSLITS
ncbi:hypothetical protein C2G38_2204244 [Gigaspora rosea]|uniref:Peptidase S1 domain-containing protein n=1 Tax=Gigaspora rosea TaxID=44941 RepID=A0A397ULJ5_9GLOM|nr:hypothetical protein C2G38_2204244 [Gigaspora rosea]